MHPDQKMEGQVIRLDNINVHYGSNQVLSNISGIFQPGSITAVVGPNGGGKTTLLKAIMGLVPISSGKIDTHHAALGKRAYLPQLSRIDRSFPLSVMDLVAGGFARTNGFFKSYGQELVDKVLEALSQVGMQAYAQHPLYTLSGGQFQRILFARLSLQDASCILLDEPFTAMDRYTIEDLVKIMLSWQKKGKTLIVVNHDLDLVHTYFPMTALIAKTVIAWGDTSTVLTLENLKKALKVSRQLECVQE